MCKNLVLNNHLSNFSDQNAKVHLNTWRVRPRERAFSPRLPGTIRISDCLEQRSDPSSKRSSSSSPTSRAPPPSSSRSCGSRGEIRARLYVSCWCTFFSCHGFLTTSSTSIFLLKMLLAQVLSNIWTISQLLTTSEPADRGSPGLCKSLCSLLERLDYNNRFNCSSSSAYAL